MNRLVLILMLLTMSITASANENDSLLIVSLQDEFNSIKKELLSNTAMLKSQQQCINNLESSVSNQETNIDSFFGELSKVKNLIEKQSFNLDSVANKVDANIVATDLKIENSSNSLLESIQQRSVWAGVGIISALVLLVLVFFILRKKINSGNSAIDKIKAAQNSLESAQKAMQEESVKLDSKLLELLEKQMIEYPQMQENNEIDHTLALKVADEIVKIEANLARMDSSIKGYKQLSKAVERIKDNFMANGYEIVDMLNKPYNEGMKVIASFVSDETLAGGEQKITGVAKPQVNFKGKMIQSAQITVSQNL